MAQRVQEENLRAIFGLKLRQFREQLQLSTQDLAKKSGLSASYINEIEKGKKYPKADKIMSLADALDVDYDEMVSLKLGKQLGQISEFLKSNAFHDMPLELFGLKTSDLIGLMGNAPSKFSALLQTLVEIARNYDVRVEHFLLAALRSYQELNNNYFDELEEAAESFLKDHQWTSLNTIPYPKLKELLQEGYNYSIIESSFDAEPELKGFRSIFVPGSSPKLFINNQLLDNQKAFVLGRELGYCVLDLSERALTSSWIKVESFDQVLNNFKASYFSGAILMNRMSLVEKLEDFFDMKTWSPEALLNMVNHFDTTPETFTHRLTQILPHYFGIDQLFFLRFHNKPGTNQYKLSKELHLSQLHNPHRVNPSEHYCRRWITVRLLQQLANTNLHEASEEPLIGIQNSRFYDTDNEYICLSFARPLALSDDTNSCVTLGLLKSDNLKKKISFLEDNSIPTNVVNESCERCPIPDCQERAAEPTISQVEQQQEERTAALNRFLEKHK